MIFKHENRYIVIKLKNLNEDQLDKLETRMDNAGIKQVQEAVVVESDWPEYERVWHMIEARVTGEITEEQYRCLVANINFWKRGLDWAIKDAGITCTKEQVIHNLFKAGWNYNEKSDTITFDNGLSGIPMEAIYADR